MKKKSLKEILLEVKNKKIREEHFWKQQPPRLIPLLWLIKKEQYTLQEVVTAGLNCARASRAEEILLMIKARQQEKNGK